MKYSANKILAEGRIESRSFTLMKRPAGDPEKYDRDAKALG